MVRSFSFFLQSVPGNGFNEGRHGGDEEMRRDEKDDGQKQPGEIPFRFFFLFPLYICSEEKEKNIKERKKGRERESKKEKKLSFLHK